MNYTQPPSSHPTLATNANKDHPKLVKKSRRRANVDLHLIQPKFPSSVATSVRNFFDHHGGKYLAVAVKVEGTTDFSISVRVEKFPNRSPGGFL